MSDLISRQAAIDVAVQSIMDWDGMFMQEANCRIRDAINELPSAHPPITHCAECIHWKHSSARKSYCEVFDWMNTAEDFCSFAERRTDE